MDQVKTMSKTEREGLLEEIRGEISHNISPVIGWLRRDVAEGNEDCDGARVKAFQERLQKAAEDVLKLIESRQEEKEASDTEDAIYRSRFGYPS